MTKWLNKEKGKLMPTVRILTLEGITLKGKNRIREHGEVWRVLNIKRWAAVDEFKDAVCIEPLRASTDTRWITPGRDPNFRVIKDETLTDAEIMQRYFPRTVN